MVKVTVYNVPNWRGSSGIKVAVDPDKDIEPATGSVPGPVTRNVPVVTEDSSKDSENTAEMVEFTVTPVRLLMGETEITEGGRSVIGEVLKSTSTQ